jgi:cell division protein ZapA
VKQVEVNIMGNGYILACPDGGETLLATAVAQVDHEMSAIRDAGKVRARERIAVLAALNLAYQLAEQQAAPPPPVPAPMPAADEGVDLAALVRRIDEALGDDGQLL